MDYEVSAVTSAREREPRGVFGEGEARKTVTAEEARKKLESQQQASPSR